jgi:hypothetical protein
MLAIEEILFQTLSPEVIQILICLGCAAHVESLFLGDIFTKIKVSLAVRLPLRSPSSHHLSPPAAVYVHEQYYADLKARADWIIVFVLGHSLISDIFDAVRTRDKARTSHKVQNLKKSVAHRWGYQERRLPLLTPLAQHRDRDRHRHRPPAPPP